MQNAQARVPRQDDRRDPSPRRHLHLVEEVDGADYDFAPTYAANGRRTVTITGQPTPARRRRSQTASRIESRPDRVALWAFVLGLFLVFMAVATASAAPA